MWWPDGRTFSRRNRSAVCWLFSAFDPSGGFRLAPYPAAAAGVPRTAEGLEARAGERSGRLTWRSVWNLAGVRARRHWRPVCAPMHPASGGKSRISCWMGISGRCLCKARLRLHGPRWTGCSIWRCCIRIWSPFLQDLAFGQETDVRRSGSRAYHADAVSLMTLHGSKRVGVSRRAFCAGRGRDSFR